MALSFLTEKNFGNVSFNETKDLRKKITERWDSIHFLDGFENYLKENMACILENEAKMMLLHEATDANNSGSFETVVFPIVRRVFSRLLSNDIVSVQAMNLPVGKLFYILPVTSERKWLDNTGQEITENTTIEELDGATGSHYGLMGYERTNKTTGNKENRYYLPDEVINGLPDNAPDVVKYYTKSLYDLFYNDGLFDQSKGKIHIKVGSLEAAKLNFDGTVSYGTAVTAPLAFDGTVRNVVMSVSGFQQIGAGRLIGPDGNEMDTESFLASLKVMTKEAIEAGDVSGVTTASYGVMKPLNFRVVTQQYGKGIVQYSDICDAEGRLLIEVDLAKPVTEKNATMDGYIGVAQDKLGSVAEQFMVAWAQYDSLELETEIGEVSFKLSEVTIATTERKLRATWSPELAQDVAAFHNIDAEAELTAILSEQIAAEIDREVLRDLRAGAPWKLKWDYQGWRVTGARSTNYTQKDWNQMLMTEINKVSAQIHKATLRGGANFIVVSSEISAVLNDLEYYHVTDANAEAVQYSMGIEKVGTLQGRYNVYVDPYSPAKWALIGHKGESLLDTGYIYAPYVPLQLTPTMYDPHNFAPVKGIMTRYAKKMVNSRYYGAVICERLQQWSINELR